jgi:hypothetical protein
LLNKLRFISSHIIDVILFVTAHIFVNVQGVSMRRTSSCSLYFR